MNHLPEFPCDNLTVNAEGVLCFAGYETPELAGTYGTPLYLMDEERIRRNCRCYREAFDRLFPAGSRPSYASKACSFKYVYKIVEEEGLGADVASTGELYTAMKAGFPMEETYFHGNAKTDGDLRFALEAGVGHIVVDNVPELLALESIAAELGKTQRILLRLTPGIDPHTYVQVNTGEIDSKFGVAIETGQAEDFVALALKQPHLILEGYHCHVGSQVFAEDVFERAVRVMLQFIAEMKHKLGYSASVLDLGGGYGVRYTEQDMPFSISTKLEEVAAVFHSCCAELDLEEPRFLMEPGRSIVADAGLTLYTVTGIKEIPGFLSYVAVDGGLTDNPRYALYGSRYTVLAPEKMREEYSRKYTVAGHCCESGDLIQKGVYLPEGLKRGDLLAVCTTGAYNYSMASNYNRYGRPPIVLLGKNGPKLAVRRETPEDIIRLDAE